MDVAKMTEGLKAERYNKHDPKKKFLEEACALIELSNIVEGYKLGQTKRCESYLCDGKDDSRNKTQRGERTDEGGLATRRRLEARRKKNRRQGPTLNNSAAPRSIRNSNESKHSTLNLEELSKCQLKMNRDINDVNEKTKKGLQKKQRLTQSHKKSKNISDKEIRQMLASNFDMANCLQLYSLKDSLRHDKLSKTQTILLPKTNISKSNLKTWKSISSLSHSLILNKRSTKRDANKRDKGHEVNESEPKKSDIAKPSWHLRLNLRLKPNSNTVNLQIKSRKKACEMEKSDVETLSISLPLQFTSPKPSNQDQTKKSKINKLSTNLNTSGCPHSTPSSSDQTTNNEKMQISKLPVSAAPYAKTQAVYSVYDVAPMQQPRKVQGIKSHIYFNVNIGRQPQNRHMPTDSSHTTSSFSPFDRSQSLYDSRMNMNSGLASMQHSYTLDRRSSQSENDLESDVCRCDRNASDPGIYSDTRRSVCSPCCPAGKPQTPLPEDLMERYALIFKRAKDRIANRVGISPQEARTMVVSPRAFLDKFYEKYKSITNKVEAQQKNVGSCTCSPFIDTEQVSVEEEHLDPECSLLKRCFGQLIYNNKCVVCTKAKGIGTDYGQLKPYECAPGTCVEKKSFLACLKKLRCTKKEKGTQKSDDKEKKKRDKEKANKEKALTKAKELEKQKKAKAKANKEQEKNRARRLKEKEKKDRLKKKERGTGLLTSVFKKPSEDDDRRWLLDEEDKKKSMKDEETKPEGGKKDTSEFENKARKTFATGKRGYRRITRRIREKYYRNKKLAEEQKGQFACDFYLMSLRNKPCLWVYYLCPWFYPYCLQLLNVWRQVSDLLLFFVAIIVWSPCILCAECLKVMACNMCVS